MSGQFGLINGEQPPTFNASINTRVLVSGQLLDFDENVGTVVERLEAARVGGNPAHLHSNGCSVYVSPEAAKGWHSAIAIGRAIKLASAEFASQLKT